MSFMHQMYIGGWRERV